MVLVCEGVLLLFRDELDCDMPEPLRDWDVIDLSEDEARAFATVGVSLDDKRYVIPKSSRSSWRGTHPAWSRAHRNRVRPRELLGRLRILFYTRNFAGPLIL